MTRTRRTPAPPWGRALLLVLAALPACVLPECDGSSPVPDGKRRYSVMGRLGFPDDRGCGSEVSGQNVSWRDCHAFKDSFDPATGKAISANYHVAGAFRPRPATVVLTLLHRAPGASGFVECGKKVVRSVPQTGSFFAQLEVDEASCGRAGGTMRVEAEVPLLYIFTNGRSGTNRKTGAVHALWRKDQADALLAEVTNSASVSADLAFEYTSGGQTLQATVPTFYFTHELADPAAAAGFDPSSGAAEIDVGLQRFADAASDDAFDYIKHLLSGFASVVKAHRALVPHVGAPAHVEKLFKQRGFVATYRVWFVAKGASAGPHDMNLLGPDVEQLTANGLTRRQQRSLSNVGVIAHELGHSIHGTFAPASLVFDYGFANPLQDPSGALYDWGHGWGQYQEMGVSFTEGLASAIGQYLVNRCNNWVGRSPVGGADPFWTNMWMPDAGCDVDGENGCSYHHIRYMLVDQLGLQEGSSEWNERVSMLLWLGFQGFLAKHRFVTSNSEGNWAQLGCDLLDDDDDVSHAEGIVNGPSRGYLGDYTYHAGRALLGEDVLATSMGRWYSADPLPAETTQITLQQLLDAMQGFCGPTRCGIWADRSVVPTRKDTDYPVKRLSALSSQSIQAPRAFFDHLIQQGLVTAAQRSVLLSTSFMDDVDDAGQ